MVFGRSDWRIFERGVEKEWLLTNGIGGFASSTVIGANTRRYHGLLVAALKPPVGRHLVLSKIDESLEINGRQYNLFSHKTPDFIMEGYRYLDRFAKNPLPTYTYSIGSTLIEKKICMVHGKNTVTLLYHIVNGEEPASMKLTPLVNFRDYHYTIKRQYMDFKSRVEDKSVVIKPYGLDRDIILFCSEGRFIPLDNCFFYNMYYPVEQERGLDCIEDHFIPGYYDVDLKPGEEKYITFIATIEKELGCVDGRAIIKEETDRIKAVVDSAGYSDEFARELVRSADDFIVYRQSTDSKTIIAGYPWFTDWGRDTMIAFPGLTLATRRFEDAKDILSTFSEYIKDGLVPNMFPDEGQEPAYNSVDAALWYFEAVYKYLKYTGDYEFIENRIIGKLKEIIESFIKGTVFDIKMDDDCLVSAGNERTQLTWMDAKVGDWVVTPRHGKAVEINALWYNSLKIMSELEGKRGGDCRKYERLAEKVRKSFERNFWNEKEHCLYDVISGDYRDSRIRPNQLFAISLSYPVVSGNMAKAIVDKVWKELYTPYGLRTLSPESDEYRGLYKGDQYYRDGAYHQGTVWPWLMGPFITAYLRVYGNGTKSKYMAARLLEPFKYHLQDSCIGSVSEIFDGDWPHWPRGCFAQAWSVGEILRVYTDLIT